MQLIEALYKVVENPTSLHNYKNLQQYFQEKGIENVVSALDHLIKVRYGTADNTDTKQDKQD